MEARAARLHITKAIPNASTSCGEKGAVATAGPATHPIGKLQASASSKSLACRAWSTPHLLPQEFGGVGIGIHALTKL